MEPKLIEIIASPEWISELKKVVEESKWASTFPVPITQAKWITSGSAWLVWSNGTTQQIAP